MLIKKSPPKRLPAPVSRFKLIIGLIGLHVFKAFSLRQLIRKLQSIPSETEFCAALAQVKEWQFPKADLFHFIPVLNRADKMLEEIISKHFVAVKRVVSSSIEGNSSKSGDGAMLDRIDATTEFDQAENHRTNAENNLNVDVNVPAIDWNEVQHTPFPAETKVIILSILNFTRLLLENATNRSIYNSYEVC